MLYLVAKIKLSLEQKLRNECDVSTSFYSVDHGLVNCDLTQILMERSVGIWVKSPTNARSRRVETGQNITFVSNILHQSLIFIIFSFLYP